MSLLDSLNNFFGVLALVLLVWLLVKAFFSSDRRKYRDVITKNKAEAKYYYIGRSKERDFTPEQRREIYKRDKGECQICKAKGRRDVKTKNAPRGFYQHVIYYLSYMPGFGFLWRNLLCQIDHIPLNSWNGDPKKDGIEIGRATHAVCNRKRPWKYPDKDFFEFCRKRGEKIYIGKGIK